ncbi:MAG: EAL domain-containing protein [Burkholderiales bacterium]|nr:EAL domain-containing protein [Burkholderiales bacterium]
MSARAAWWLERIAADGSALAVPVSPLPFGIGRDEDSGLVLVASGVSRRHATLTLDASSGRLLLADLGSTNGCFVNRERIDAPRLLDEGDIVHIGSAEFRIRRADAGARDSILPAEERTVITAPGSRLSEQFVANEAQFLALLGGDGLSAAVQPIVNAGDGRVVAYELLGRCTHPELPASPMHLFSLATRLGRAGELSHALREHGVAAVAPRLRGATLFVNAHPTETSEPGFVPGIARLVREHPGIELVIEIHETAVVETARMRELGARLADIGVRFAYDDFGAGQARLNELSEAPPHFVKFDMALVNGLAAASARKQRVVSDLVRLVIDLGSVALAEGIEAEADAELCRQMGFRLMQGYLFGKPVPVATL